jgi:exodeoxyribonuclease V alpha subunit
MDDASQLELAYSMTVHKSQGNEFQAVVIPMFPGPSRLYYRNLLYTAVTRAKSLLILVGMERIVETMVRNNRKNLRYSGLSHFLVEGIANEN